MASATKSATATQTTRAGSVALAEPSAPTSPALAEAPVDREKVLPLPRWLVKVYFIFPIILYIPDILFNYYVYSDGFGPQSTNPLIAAGKMALFGFLSVGVVGMAYLLSMLAPWHWGQGHHIQAFFCGLGVVIATAITTWNSLAYRSQYFIAFPMDKWAYSMWPQLEANHVSVTMVFVAVAPPFWGLFWAVVQPTATGRSLRQLQESHAERLMRLQQEAELKRLRAETNARVREAQLRGMAQTAAAARAQTRGFFAQARTKTDDEAPGDGTVGADEQAPDGEVAQTPQDAQPTALADDGELAGQGAASILQYPTYVPSGERVLTGSRGGAVMMNHAAATAPGAHVAPAGTLRPATAQPPLLREVSGADTGGLAGDVTLRRPPVLGGVHAFFPPDALDADAMTGTSGPHHAIRRPTEMSSLTRTMNEPLKAVYVNAVREAIDELNPSGKRKNIPAAELVSRVARKLDVDESMARQILTRYREMQKAARS